MKYNINELAEMYVKDLAQKDFDITTTSQSFDPSTYNEYTYRQLIKQYDKLYNNTDSVALTEKFLKGE